MHCIAFLGLVTQDTVKNNSPKWFSRFAHIRRKLIVPMLCVTAIKLKETRHGLTESSAMNGKLLRHGRAITSITYFCDGLT